MSSDWAGTHHACISQSRLRLVLFYAVYSQVFPWIKHVEFVAGVKQVLLMSFGKSALPPHSREWTRPLHVLAVQCLLQTSPVTQPPVHCIHTTQTYILFGRPMPAACEVWSAKSMRNDCYISANVLWTPTLILKLTISSEGSEQTFPTIYCPYGNIVNFPHAIQTPTWDELMDEQTYGQTDTDGHVTIEYTRWHNAHTCAAHVP